MPPVVVTFGLVMVHPSTVEEGSDGHRVVGSTPFMNRSWFSVDRLEAWKDIFRIAANRIPEKTNPVFADIRDQMPSRHKLSCGYRYNPVFGTFWYRYKVPQKAGTVY